MKRGFSLVELSIVLVILGLLVGGILAGQSLIRASELRAVSTEFNKYKTASMAFRDKYFALPGDMPNATTIWGSAASGAACNTTLSTGVATCDGDGDSVISPITNSNELFRFWQHLANAGMIEGTYSGADFAGGASGRRTNSTNAPISKLSGGLWNITSGFNPAGASNDTFAASYGNLFMLGAFTSGTDARTALVKPEEAWNIDTKLDDGKPGTGTVMARWYNTCTAASGPSDVNAAYSLNSTTLGCALLFPRVL